MLLTWRLTIMNSTDYNLFAVLISKDIL